mgnify:CR=1 FL=1
MPSLRLPNAATSKVIYHEGYLSDNRLAELLKRVANQNYLDHTEYLALRKMIMDVLKYESVYDLYFGVTYQNLSKLLAEGIITSIMIELAKDEHLETTFWMQNRPFKQKKKRSRRSRKKSRRYK